MASFSRRRYALAASCLATAFAIAGAFTSNVKTNTNPFAVKANAGPNANPVLGAGFANLDKQTALLMSAVEDSATTGSSSIEDYVKAQGGDRVIRKILIANNGMAATKSIISMRQWAYMELGDEKLIQFVAMATPEDLKANAEYIRLADSFVEVPGGKNLNNYANVDVIVKIAKEQGVDAVWPGWGHASENPRLPNTLDEMGIKFIGPTGPVMSVLGDKIAANILAQTANVPSIPWSGSYGGPDDGPLQAELNDEGTIPDEIFEKATCRTVEEAIVAAKKIGYENGIMIKASEGGGGKGIRFVDNESELQNAYEQVSAEVIGSPIFLMQLCKNARHLEVQIVGDQHGNAVALNGRDCSTQRRFQKIFEEGPPIIAPKETFREMERAAQRLTQSIGYQGAGTVEYLFNADTGKYFFLELNPRLQVEHPVTEGVTDVNLPATQLQVAMGIPLYNIPQIRRLYGKEDIYAKDDKIDFLVEEYREINTHIIAARITAENPDEGFKPTSGSIERIKFQSTPDCWGYFSVGANGGIHEFADSQFGHLFAKGPTREEARKSLILALKEIEVRGEIRTTVEYLVQLLETKKFKENTIDTAWLDGIIREKSVSVQQPPHLVVASAAIMKAHEHVKNASEEVKESFRKGQVSTSGIPGINSFDLEIAYQDTKYPFHIDRISNDVYRLTLNGISFDAQITVTAEGALLATFGGETHRIFGMDEPLGLRLSVDGVTILMPTIFDPSELRTDVTGKVVRYLQENGADVEVGQPFVEVEAMKMIMPIKATESGKITHNFSPGTVISAGDLLASLQLKDPSKVKKILPFDGELDIPMDSYDFDETEALTNVLGGYDGDVEATVAAALQVADTKEAASELVVNAVNEFVRVESLFDGKLKDDVVRQLTKDNAETLDDVIALNQAHAQINKRSEVMISMMRQVDLFNDRFGQGSIPSSVFEALEALTKFQDKKVYGEVAIAAEKIIRDSKVPAFEIRIEDLRRQLVDEDADLDKLAKSATLSAGVDLLTSLFQDEREDVRTLAVEVYIRRVYRAHRILDIAVFEVDGQMQCKFSFRFADVPQSKSVVRHGLLSVVSSDIATALPTVLSTFGTDLPKVDYHGPANVLHLVSVDAETNNVEKIEEALISQSKELNMLGVRTVNLCVPIAKKEPLYYSFIQCDGFKENPLRRNMRPTFHHLLELSRLDDNFDLERLPSVQRNAQVYIGTEKTKKYIRGGPPQVVLVRGISHAPGLISFSGSRRALIQGLDELERAQTNPKVNNQASSRIFLHSLPEIEDMSAKDVASKFAEIMGQVKSRLAARLLKLRVDEIEVKVRIQTTDEDGNSVIEPVRLVASSVEGEWLKTTAFSERPDPITGVTQEFCVLGDGTEDEVCMLDPYASSNIIGTKRAIARRVGSTYAYDFLGLLEVGLIGQWDAHLTSLDDVDTRMPTNLFSKQELIEDEDGTLVPGSRTIGTNKFGMVSWLVNMKTPEYPEGREAVFVANDVTVQSGSFGVDEDEHYMKASQFARARGIPRVYIACNAGARIGLVDELKPKFQIKFVDESSPNKGFEYLYLSDENYKALPEGTVNAHKVTEGWAIDDIIGTKHGIGVENLQGSGMIAGETSRAYDEIFTLSYVTGRSVGIGAYLVRLGQRVIQMKQGPLLLTGFGALNKLLGRDVYNSQDQLGGPQIMFPNGVSHEIVDDDQEGVASILQWLSFVPKYIGALPASRDCSDPVDRDVEFRPTPIPYDPRSMLAGTADQKGFFDEGSYKEYLAGWGKSVVVGRGRLGGISMGAIAVETRLVEQIIPADPADPNSREAVLPQAGQVLFPDSSYKTAQAIRDFDNEGLPVMIFANWRGFSGGSRDMAGEILKFGAMIVDALREYKHPVYIYLPPHGELRGGSWVVVDPTINEEKMSMYADPDSRGGILEPAGIIEVKFREKDQFAVMHRLDPQLQLLDSELDGVSGIDDEAAASIKENIAARESELKAVYTQVATEFADLHDKTGRMKAKGVIKEAVPWNRAREFFFYLAQRRILEDDFIAQIKKADPTMDSEAAIVLIKSMCSADYDDNKAVIAFFTSNVEDLSAKVVEVKKAAVAAQIDALQKELGLLGEL